MSLIVMQHVGVSHRSTDWQWFANQSCCASGRFKQSKAHAVCQEDPTAVCQEHKQASEAAQHAKLGAYALLLVEIATGWH